jgi:hypothetical protein
MWLCSCPALAQPPRDHLEELEALVQSPVELLEAEHLSVSLLLQRLAVMLQRLALMLQRAVPCCIMPRYAALCRAMPGYAAR